MNAGGPAPRPRVALITGASGGIGAATSRRLAEERYSLVLTGRRADALRRQVERAAELTPHPVRATPADVRSEGDRARLLQAAAEDFEVLDALILCAAALVSNGGLLTSEPEDLREALEVKVHASLALVRQALPLLAKGDNPAVVFVAGTSARYPSRESLITSVTNAALLAATGVLADELAPEIRVVAVSPGPTRTPRWDHLVGDLSRRTGVGAADVERRTAAAVLAGRMVEADEVAAVVAFVAGPRAGAISGSEVCADGGYAPGRTSRGTLP